MRKLLNTLFVVSEESFLSLEGENVLVKNGNIILARFPLHTLDGIICFSYYGASPALLGACARKNIAFSFVTPNGRFLARTSGFSNGNVLLRREQYRISDDKEKSLDCSKGFIQGKLFNSRWVLERSIRDHALRIDVDAMKKKSLEIKLLLSMCSECGSHEELLGIEGKAAVIYFDAMNDLILRNKEVFNMTYRSRRPPLDPLNAVLSFLYSILAHDCASALESVGLDSYVGMMHRDRPGRQSLSLDLMEELRPIMADRLALTLINRQMLTDKHFVKEAAGGVFLTDEGRKVIIKAWQEKKKEQIRHPFTAEKIEWGLVPYFQALLLARYIRRDLDAYPPFFWK